MLDLRIYIVFLLCCWFSGIHESKAQTKNEQHVSLPEVVVLDSTKISNNKVEFLLNHSDNLIDYIRIYRNNGVTIKSQGPGQLATLIVRGTYGASHKIQWEGLNINDPLVGSSDMSLLNNAKLDKVSFQHHGTGNIGSVINISHDLKFDTAFNTFGSFSYVQNGVKQLNAGVEISNLKISSSSEINLSQAINNFCYVYKDEILQREHNENRGINIKHATDLKLNKYNLGLRIWMNRSERNIPAILGGTIGRPTQNNASYKVLLSIKRIKNRYDYKINFANIYHELNYMDLPLSIRFRGTSNSSIAKIYYNYYISPNWIIKNDISTTYISTQSTGFLDKNNDAQISIRPSLNKYFLNNELMISTFAHVNYAYNDLQKSTGGISLNWNMSKSFSVKSILELVNQIPSFNDLYWIPGGNINLKSSNGWGSELGFKWNRNDDVILDLQLFNKDIKNQIIWLPNKGVFSAINIPLTWSRGLIINLQLNKLFTLPLSVLVHYDFTRSTYEQSRIPNDNTNGKQLIFIPIHQFTTTLVYKYKDWEMNLSNSWSGRRYTSSDNSSFLNAYSLIDVFVMKDIIINNRISTQFRLGMTNLLNSNYELQRGWPMPGRQIMAQMSFELNKK